LLAEMANQEHLDILAKGIAEWNEWRNQHSAVMPDLSGANLDNADLTDGNFLGARMAGAKMREAALLRADCSGADLGLVDFSGAMMRGAILDGVGMSGAVLVGTDLSSATIARSKMNECNLKNANLGFASITRSDLENADLTEAKLFATIFSDTNLSGVLGLEHVKHEAPSTIGIDTIYRSGGTIPDSFLRGCGVPDNFIAYMKSLTGAALDFYSVFISYATKDQQFADRLHADLQARGVRCWFAPHDIQGGKKIHEQIDEAIKVYDKLLLILSDASMNSNWVKTEIANARAKEQQQKWQMLFPITLVPYDNIKSWKLFDGDTGIDSAREIREYFVPDFSNWKDHDSYAKVFERLVRDLNAEPKSKGTTTTE
jgi:uncharacterized protein YjbI with pentapeptide repeats